MTPVTRELEALAIVQEVNSCGVILLLSDGRLRAWGKLACLPKSLLERVRAHREDVCRFLREQCR